MFVTSFTFRSILIKTFLWFHHGRNVFMHRFLSQTPPTILIYNSITAPFMYLAPFTRQHQINLWLKMNTKTAILLKSRFFFSVYASTSHFQYPTDSFNVFYECTSKTKAILRKKKKTIFHSRISWIKDQIWKSIFHSKSTNNLMENLIFQKFRAFLLGKFSDDQAIIKMVNSISIENERNENYPNE